MYCSKAKRVFQAAVNAVLPDHLVAANLARRGNILYFGDEQHILSNNVYVVGFGKAVTGMCRQVQEIVGNHIVSGMLSVPSGILNDLMEGGKSSLLPMKDDRIVVCEGASNNFPDETSLNAAQRICSICEDASDGDLVITLVSGGGSALLPYPTPPLTLEEKSRIVKTLSSNGATIQELNTVRQSLSMVKGGKLAEIAFPAHMWGFILSDIIDDPIELIASGPTIPASTNVTKDAVEILKSYDITQLLPAEMYATMEAKSVTSDTVPSIATRVFNKIIGNNDVAIDSARDTAIHLGFSVIVLSHRLHGEAKELGRLFARISALSDIKDSSDDSLIKNIKTSLKTHGTSDSEIENFFDRFLSTQKDGLQLCIIAGGESTVTLTPDAGLGGRNQEMVLAFALSFATLKTDYRLQNTTFLSAGTDGQDGPTLAAGAVFTSEDLTDFDQFEAEHYLKRHDTYTYFKRHNKNLVVTGMTGTNVMDIHVLMLTQQ